jgi:CheY-like chemotaxis protein
MPSDTWRPLRILLVASHADTSAALAKLLAGEAHLVRCAADAADAARAADAGGPFDLLVCDVPGPAGDPEVDAIRDLRARCGAAAAAAAIGLGGGDDLGVAAEVARRAGFAYHLSKPVQWPDLKALVDRAARAGGGGPLS